MLSKLIFVPIAVLSVSTGYFVTGAVSASVGTSSAIDLNIATDEDKEPREVQILVVSENKELDQKEIVEPDEDTSIIEEIDEKSEEILPKQELNLVSSSKVKKVSSSKKEKYTVPFYSQFSDISKVSWQKVGCGIASLAMLIDFYSDENISVDSLLEKGIASGAYLDNAGWIHSGLINLSKVYGLDGESVSLSGLTMADAFARFSDVVAEGPVMASVHYTFEPTNPIPHLVVITGVSGDNVFYNDPAEPAGGGTLSVDKFQKAWKKRYIEIRPS